jgi:glycine/D-amino acid oxidase-like deaminating enzyme
MAADYDVAVVGGGLVGVATAWGLARAGLRVTVLDEDDQAQRASRGNFALVWVQSKGLGMAPYAGWTVRSSNAWGGFAELLREETGLDVAFQRPGGFHLALSQRELEARANTVKRLHNQPGIVEYKTEILDRTEVVKMLPDIGPDVVGGSYCPLDGHVNSLRLLRTLHAALKARGAVYKPNHTVTGITHQNGEFHLHTSGGLVVASKVALAAGNANMKLAPMVGLEAPMRPERGQIVVTERLRPFLKHPVVTVRQTDEGTVMIGDSKEDTTDPTGLTLGVAATEAKRAVRMFPLLAGANVVRTWSAIRVMTEDGFPIYDESPTQPGAFVLCCHSGVTLAANHALSIAPMIANGALDGDLLAPFSARRFHVQAAG